MLRVEGLQRRVGAFELLIEQWTIERGQYLVLVGPSGAGKTMFLETAAGLHQPDAGRIWIDGRDVTREPPERRSIGFVYQDCWLFPHRTVRQNIDFGRRYHRSAGPAAQTTDELAEMLHIAGLLERKPLTLSGGERQRVALARALAVRPRLLFLDEPLGTLDPVTRELVAAELLGCHRAFGMTTIHVTHDHTEARMIGDAAAVILRGKLEQVGPTDDLFRHPRTPQLARFLGCENLFEAQAAAGASAEMVRVRLGEASFEVQSRRTGRVAVCVRPEDVLVEPAAGGVERAVSRREGDAAMTLSGRITEVSQRGAVWRLVIAVGYHHWASLISHSQQRDHRFGQGDSVRLLIPADALHLIPLP